ncbi:acyl-CoA dehydrogenase [Nocardioides sp.]|uniref:acyl-CoA dehydrogenase n=1 Tax=Nocardioides sp. TaxID=35761 RepID=UPI0027358421|nr:acyl-CoA dehydrogenase [Nocardioides sp.]MDP3892322.1 acyl-CoA dehydrogenase [Nocardioides sp.]
MALAITDDHEALGSVTRDVLTGRGGYALARAHLDRAEDLLDPIWAEVCRLGWPGIHIGEEYGGQGFGLPELVVVLEEVGRYVVPIPLLSSGLGSAVIQAVGTDAQKNALLPGLAAGEQVCAVGTTGGALSLADGLVSGDAGPVLAAGVADVLLLPLGEDLVLVRTTDPGVEVEAVDSLDPTVRVARVTLTGVEVDEAALVRGGRPVAERLGRLLAAAEAVGGAYACTEMAVNYARVREQFGRPIGTFQAVKHHCADMRVAAELGTALVWDAARIGSDSAQADLLAAAAANIALPAYQEAAQKNIQLHGGIGFTWEHDAHLHLRRSIANGVVFGGEHPPEDDVARLAAAGVRRTFELDLPEDAEFYRGQARAYLEKFSGVTDSERRRSLAESGYLVPHWPEPYGRNAGPVEQLVIEEEFADVELPSLGIGGWVVLTLLQQGNDEQRKRWVGPSLAGDYQWCQLFSEPGAGSDSASVRTRAIRVEDGWRVTGQKVWTSGAQHCNIGLATVRTDPDAAKHAGITTMVIDMTAAGVSVRPLREITGEAMFNEVFLDDVFVPDVDVVGEVNGGWKVARATLGNERVSIGAGSREGLSAYALLPLLSTSAPRDAELWRVAGRLIAQELAMRLLNVRSAARAVAGGGPGVEGNITKLLSAEHAQRVTEAGLRIAGRAAISGGETELMFEYLFDRCLSIAGGTSEITRNVIAERILGLPRDPLIK